MAILAVLSIVVVDVIRSIQVLFSSSLLSLCIYILISFDGSPPF